MGSEGPPALNAGALGRWGGHCRVEAPAGGIGITEGCSAATGRFRGPAARGSEALGCSLRGPWGWSTPQSSLFVALTGDRHRPEVEPNCQVLPTHSVKSWLSGPHESPLRRPGRPGCGAAWIRVASPPAVCVCVCADSAAA